MSKAIYTIEKIMPLPFGSCGKKAFTKEEVKKYIIENIDWLLSLDCADWGKQNGCFIVEKIELLEGKDNENE